jgi:Putative prokaryotic signal transducing protein
LTKFLKRLQDGAIMNDEAITNVYVAPTVEDAHFLVNLLAESGIMATVANEHFSGLFGIGTAHMGPGLMVRSEEAAAARRIIAEWENAQRVSLADDQLSASPAPVGWRCLKCGEEVRQDFEICWNCQAARPDSPTNAPGPDGA